MRKSAEAKPGHNMAVLFRAAAFSALFFLCSCQARTAAPPSNGIPDREELSRALSLLAQAGTNDCPVCVEKLRKEAVELLSGTFVPGRRFSGNDSCPLVRMEQTDCLALACPPFRDEGGKGNFSIFFRLQTQEKHLAGSKAGDYTSPDTAGALSAGAPGARFFGTMEVAAFAYGDGPSFLLRKDAVMVFVRVLEISPWP